MLSYFNMLFPSMFYKCIPFNNFRNFNPRWFWKYTFWGTRAPQLMNSKAEM